MADNLNIDKLTIEIGIEASKAASGLKDIAKSLRDLGNNKDASSSMQRVASNVKDLTTTSSKAADRIEKLGESAKNSSKPFSKSGGLVESIRGYSTVLQNAAQDTRGFTFSLGKLGEFLSTVKRIAVYRAIRSSIKAIAAAVKEGVNNLVEWDAALGNNSSGALRTMTEIKSTALQVKNTLGALAMPIIQGLLPVLRAAAKILIGISNIVNQIIRGFQGYDTYMKATYVEVSAVEDSLGGAGKKAKELQKVLFGFDELNILPDPNSGSGSGGSGGLGGLNDYFDEVKSKSGLANFGKWLAKAWQDVKNAYLVAAEWLDKNFFTPVAKFAQKLGEDIGKFLQDPIGTLERAWGDFKLWIKTNITSPVGGFFSALGQSVKLVFDYIFHPSQWGTKDLGAELKAIWDEVFKSTTTGAGKSQEYLDKNPLIPAYKDSPFQEKVKGTKTWLAKNPLKPTTVTPSVDLSKITKGVNDENAWLNKNPLKPSTTKPSVDLSTIKKNVEDGKSWLSKNPLKPNTTNPTVDTSKVRNGINNENTWLSKNPLNAKVNNPKLDTSGVEKAVANENKYLSSNPLKIALNLTTRGFNDSVANVYKKMQGTLQTTPLVMGVQGTATGISNSAVGAAAKRISATAYAEGGVPDVGTLFYAGESGSEIVANMSHGTGVMNVKQMQEAVASGNVDVVNAIYAMANTLAREIRDKDTNAYISQDAIGRAATNYQFNQSRRGVAY